MVIKKQLLSVSRMKEDFTYFIQTHPLSVQMRGVIQVLCQEEIDKFRYRILRMNSLKKILWYLFVARDRLNKQLQSQNALKASWKYYCPSLPRIQEAPKIAQYIKMSRLQEFKSSKRKTPQHSLVTLFTLSRFECQEKPTQNCSFTTLLAPSAIFRPCSKSLVHLLACFLHWM